MKGPTLSQKPRQAWGSQLSFWRLAIDGDVEDVGHLEIRPVVEHQVPADYDVNIVRWRGRKHDFQFMRTRLHSALQNYRQGSVHDQLALHLRRQTIALGPSGWQVIVVSAIPLVNVSVMIGIARVFVIIAMFVI